MRGSIISHSANQLLCLTKRIAYAVDSTREWHCVGARKRRRCVATDGERVRLYSRPGNDLTKRFPLIVEALARLRPRSCIIDGEAVACGADGIASFDRIRYRRHDADVFLYAFDLIEQDGEDMRRDPLAVRKATLASVLARAAPGLRFNEHLDEADGPLVFEHALAAGLIAEAKLPVQEDSLGQWVRSFIISRTLPAHPHY
jgi:bifunctional non-homologous end joining protein LigD